MMKRGRPKNLARRENRKKTVRLSILAASFLHDVVKKRPDFDFSRYVSECIVRDFRDNPKDFLKFKLLRLQYQMSDIQDDINKVVVQLRNLDDEDMGVIVDKELFKELDGDGGTA